MAKSLIITEKPSVAQEFARILGVSGRNDGYIENDGYVITWCVGHLVEMVYPEEYDERYKKWRLEDLPFLPRDYKYNVIPSVSRQYDVVHKMLHREDIDTVYWAGDAGKEGQTIEENIRKFGGVREGMKELRVWIDSQTEEEILRGIREAKDMSEYDNLAKSGVMRTIEDYAMGINFSRAMSVKYGKLLNDAAGTSSYRGRPRHDLRSWHGCDPGARDPQFYRDAILPCRGNLSSRRRGRMPDHGGVEGNRRL